MVVKVSMELWINTLSDRSCRRARALPTISTSKDNLSKGYPYFKVSLHSIKHTLDRTDEYFVFIIVIH